MTDYSFVCGQLIYTVFNVCSYYILNVQERTDTQPK